MQLRLSFSESPYHTTTDNEERLQQLLTLDFNFHGQNSTYASHALHAFPAKFPPQLPAQFIQALTEPGERVLDPMMGSGTTLLEAQIAGRQPFGCDIDPLAARITQSKLSTPNLQKCADWAERVIAQAQQRMQNLSALQTGLEASFDAKSLEFIYYWFDDQTRLELFALKQEIDQISDDALRRFFMIIFSAIIITKSGGVSRALDLAHTRPHRSQEKTRRPVFAEFRKRIKQTLRSWTVPANALPGLLARGNAQAIPLPNNSIDLIVTSPPYASNAIDYMRANKFSLVWMGYSISELSKLRSTYIGGEAAQKTYLSHLPPYTAQIVQALTEKDARKGRTLARYYNEMQQALREMYRVLKPDKCAIVVVGTSIIREIDVETPRCLAEIGQQVGLRCVGIAERQLDRDKRMMPARFGKEPRSQIEQRMHSEHILGFIKPERPNDAY